MVCEGTNESAGEEIRVIEPSGNVRRYRSPLAVTEVAPSLDGLSLYAAAELRAAGGGIRRPIRCLGMVGRAPDHRYEVDPGWSLKVMVSGVTRDVGGRFLATPEWLVNGLPATILS